ncbi:MAG: primosomal protein N', partial [Gammaproteobacteria bacterium]
MNDSSASATWLRVAVPTPLDRLFDYRLPAEQSASLGARVRVPFGRRKLVGVVVEIGVEPDCDPAKIRDVDEVIDDQPMLDETELGFLNWVARYYHHPLGEVLATAMPNAVMRGEPLAHTPQWCWFQSENAGEAPDLARAPRQAELLDKLREHTNGLPPSELDKLDFDWRPSMRALSDKGLAERRDSHNESAETHDDFRPQAAPTLNDEQQTAVDAVLDSRDQFQSFALEGVTGSGKTEVYLGVAQKVIEAGKQVLLLVPEIGLTPQLTERFTARLGPRSAQLHSGMTDRARLDAWLDVRSGRADWLIGTRSALFTPMPRLGLIIVDEEHDPSFKQQEGLRYSARDLALIRARDAHIPVILGSATPSLETLRKALDGHYQHLRLSKRAGNAQSPRLRIQDIRNMRLHDGLSNALLSDIESTLNDGRQVLLFLNRRGYAPVLSCHHCGWVAECQRCDARLTIHQGDRRLRCHHCGAEQYLEETCPACGAEDLARTGAGTERIEDILQERFAGMDIERIDRDATRRKGELDRKLARAHAGQPCILVGTQMLAKGHDFPNVGLVGIVNGDDGLFGLDFRSAERMAQLVVQVAGRAGRGEKPGEVVIQTCHPDNPQLKLLLDRGYQAFARELLSEREMAIMPPYAHLALLRAEAHKPGEGMAFLEQAANICRSFEIDGLFVWGPARAPME